MLAWFGYICSGFVILLVLWITIRSWRSYARFKRSPEKQWRDRVLALMDTITRRITEERATMRKLGVVDAAADDAVRKRTLELLLNDIPVRELESYPGIGPATVARLRDAGCENLGDLHEHLLEDLGLGPKRQADVRHAVDEMVQQVRSRMDNSDTIEAQALEAHLEVARASRTEAGYAAGQRFLAAVKLMEKLEPRAEQAMRIDLAAHVRRELYPEILGPMMRQRLPDLDATMRATDEASPRQYLLLQQGIDAETAPERPRPPRKKGRRDRARRHEPRPVEPPVDLFRHALQSAAPQTVTAPAAPPEGGEVREDPSMARKRLTVQFAYAVARADGSATRKEKQVIHDRLRRLFGQDSIQFNQVQAFGDHYERTTIDLDACLHEIINLFTIEERRELLNWAGKISDASGKRNKQRKEFLDRVARKLGLAVAPAKSNPSVLPFPTATLSPVVPTAPAVPAPPPPPPGPTLQQRRAALEIDPATPLSADLVRRQFNLLSERYTPDKFASAGAEFVALARTKFDAAREAATALLEQLGEKLETKAPPAEPPALRHNPDLDAMFGDERMSIFEEVPLSDLDQKTRATFGEHVVVKSLAQQNAFHGLPRYVAEYLIAKYVNPDTWIDDLAKVQAKIKDLLPDLDRRELVKDRLLRMGETTLIDNVEARVDLRSGQRWARVPSLNDDKVRVPAPLLEQSPGLLLGGLWGTVKIRYAPEVDAANPNEIVAFTPFQVGPPDVATYRARRSQFSTDEWIGLMLQSVGYAPQAFPQRRHRLLLLARLIPLVERNVNLVELGPRQTGKTFLLRNVSPRVFTLSGGKTTPANLFVNLSTKAVGILGTRKVVVLDEIAHTTFGDEDATISTLKDFMESGQFSRGAKSFAADASLVFTGNLNVEGEQPDARYRHLFEPLPKELIDSAFLDRIHGYLPGWEVPKITPAALSQGVGFVTDYFGEILVKLREDDFQGKARSLEYAAGMTRRDQVAVERLTSGFIKLIYPDDLLTDEELHEVVALACEFRQRVHNQITEIAPGEFKPRLIGIQGMTEHAAADLLRRSREVPPQDDRLNREAVVGAVTGLAVLEKEGVGVGGDLILIQVSAFAGKGHVEVTGLHGPVLRNSVQTAYNIVRSRFHELGINEKRLREQVVAVHLVRIAEPKEGPSAGLPFVVGIVSALTGRAVKPACAMTGEVTLHGEITAVGGVPFKIRTAVKAGRKLVLIPAENARDVAQVPEDILAQVEVMPVKTIQEALARVLE